MPIENLKDQYSAQAIRQQRQASNLHILVISPAGPPELLSWVNIEGLSKRVRTAEGVLL
jgi:hypothetical protein